ncbi:hypothetical protein PHYPO_G00006920 [Pangasianodon hypophthalmus]|uniref:Uncharacterized protein n=1 Tax=Pangasianodon hypophthalmus TaxID=310915 RepID=A0A5N5Q6Q4_PANHP|nr:hypothetical protein PHYPO_G00006920 [Pangasianodon hypophthalmus]
MADWNDVNAVDGQWWELAYKLFLESDPMKTILNHAEYYMRGDKWNDYGFNCDTVVPPTGEVNDVSKKAILVVISRARRMQWKNWINLDQARLESVQDLEKQDKMYINCVTDLIYEMNSSPRQFNR